LHLRTDDNRNLIDIGRYVVRAVQQSTELKDALGETDAADFADALIERCRGVWAYIRYVLDEIRAGHRSVAQVGHLPDGLWRYYAQTIERLRAAGDWHCTLPLLTTLAVTVDPLPAASLAKFAEVDPDLVEDLLEGPLRAFCTVTQSSHGPVDYVIYHATFREFLLGTEPAAQLPPLRDTSQAHRLRRTLSRATRRADQRVVARYMTAWGGLEAGLPRLAAEPALFELDGGYGCRWLFSHMLWSDQASALHFLLTLETPGEDDRRHNLWFRVHHDQDKIGYYFNDVVTAYQCARAATDSHHTEGQPAPSIGLELRYMLIQASLVAVADRLPVEAVNSLVRSGKWPLERALEYARLSTDDASTGNLISWLARTLVESTLPNWPKGDECPLPYLSPAPEPPAFIATERHWTQLLNAARELFDPDVRAHTLWSIAPDLPGDLSAHVMREAYESALQIADQSRRATMLSLIATTSTPDLDADLRSQAWREAVEAASTSDQTRRARDLTELATKTYLPPDLRLTVLEAMTTIEDPKERADAFAAAAHFLSGSMQSRALRQLMRTIPAVHDEAERASLLESAQRWLKDTLPRLPTAESDAWYEAALSLISAFSDEDLRDKALRAVRMSAPRALTPRLYEVAQTITDPARRAAHSQWLASCLPEGQVDKAWKATVEAVAAVEDHSQQAIALMGLLVALPERRQHELVDTSLAEAHPYLAAPIAGADPYGRRADEDSPDHVGQSLGAVWSRTIDAVVALPDGELLTDVVLFLWSRLPASRRTVLDRVAAIGDQEAAAQLLSYIARSRCSADVRDHLIQLAGRFRDGQHESWVLCSLAEYDTPRPLRPVMFARAVSAVLRVQDPLRRARVLTAHLGQNRYRLDEETQVLACAEALRTAADVPDETERAHILFSLRESITDDLRPTAVALAEGLTDPELRADALYRLVPRPWANGSPDSELVPSLNDHDTLSACVEILCAHRGGGQEKRPSGHWSEARTTLVTDDGVILRWPGGGMDPAHVESRPSDAQIDHDALERTLSELQAAASIQMVTPREALLKWLCTATDHIRAEGGQHAITETLRAVNDVGRWWP